MLLHGPPPPAFSTPGDRRLCRVRSAYRHHQKDGPLRHPRPCRHRRRRRRNHPGPCPRHHPACRLPRPKLCGSCGRNCGCSLHPRSTPVSHPPPEKIRPGASSHGYRRPCLLYGRWNPDRLRRLAVLFALPPGLCRRRHRCRRRGSPGCSGRGHAGHLRSAVLRIRRRNRRGRLRSPLDGVRLICRDDRRHAGHHPAPPGGRTLQLAALSSGEIRLSVIKHFILPCLIYLQRL